MSEAMQSDAKDIREMEEKATRRFEMSEVTDFMESALNAGEDKQSALDSLERNGTSVFELLEAVEMQRLSERVCATRKMIADNLVRDLLVLNRRNNEEFLLDPTEEELEDAGERLKETITGKLIRN